MSETPRASLETAVENADENIIDFKLLQRRLSAISPSESSSSSRASTILSEVWPLYLKTTFVDHYVFGDLIGSGSYAEVRECIDTRSLQRCAVKIVDKLYLSRQAPSALMNQIQEIRFLRRLRHPNIIEMKECLTKGPKFYMILEHCTFVLSDLLAEQPEERLPVSLARNLFQQLCTGIDYLHSFGIVHRDIKPQNLLITNCGVLKIIDFGVSHQISMWTQDDSCSNYEGSPLFQAPEVVSGQTRYAGFKVDIWSAGVTLNLMIFGLYPFHDEALLGLYDKILSEEPVIPVERLDSHQARLVIADLLASMLEKEATRRASIEEVLAHPWLKLGHLLNPDKGHSQFMDLSTEQTSHLGEHTEEQHSMELQTIKDVYRSTSVLPYLYNHHFPDSFTTKARRESPVPFSRNLSPVVAQNATMSPRAIKSPSPLSSLESTCTSTGSRLLADPNEVLEERSFEWGTQEQYRLLKLPHIRANRIRSERGFNRSRRRTGARSKRHSRK